MINAKPTPSPATEDQFPLPGSLEDWTTSKLLQMLFPDVRLRQGFMLKPYLEQVTLREVLHCPNALERYLAECGRLPQCCALFVKRLRDVIERTGHAMLGRGRVDPIQQHVMYSHVAATRPQMSALDHQLHGGLANGV